MEEVTQLLKIEIDQKAVNDAIKKIQETNVEINKLKITQKELEIQGKQNSKEYIANSASLKALNDTVRQNSNILKANEKVQTSNADSITQMREKLKIVSKQWADLSKAERENEEIGGKLARQKLELTEILKKEEKATGDTRRNVGNYTEGVTEALKQTGLFSNQFGVLAKAQQVYTTTMKGVTFATASFGNALKATGIGLVITLVASVISYFSQFQEGIDKVSQAFAAVKTFVKVFIDALANLGQSIVGQIMPILNGLWDVISGLVTFNFDKVSNGFNAIGEAVSKIEPINLVEVGKAAIQAAKDAARLEKQLQQITVAEKDLEVQRKKSRAEINKLRQAAEDETNTLQQRFEFQKQAILLEQQGINEAVRLGKERLEVLKAQNALTNSNEADLQKVRDQEIALASLQEESTNKQIELQGKLRALNAQIQAEKEQAAKDSLAQLTQQLIEQEAIENAFFEKQRETQKEIIATELNDLKEKFIQGLISEQEYNDAINQMQVDALAIRKLNAELAIEDANNDLSISEAERLRIITEAEKEIEAVRGESLNKQLEASKAAKSKEIEQEKILADFKKSTRADVLNFVVEVFGKESLAGKLAASYQAGLNTYEGITNALAKGSPPLNFINAALVGAQGAIQIAKINSTSAPTLQGISSSSGGGSSQPKRTRSFADGGYTGEGFGTPDSSGYKPAGIVHEGEYVVKKSIVDSPSFGGILQTLEGARLKGYANGGFVGRSVGANVSNNSEITALRSDLQRFADRPSIVQVSEINRVNNQVQKVKVSGRLS